MIHPQTTHSYITAKYTDKLNVALHDNSPSDTYRTTFSIRNYIIKSLLFSKKLLSYAKTIITLKKAGIKSTRMVLRAEP